MPSFLLLYVVFVGDDVVVGVVVGVGVAVGVDVDVTCVVVIVDDVCCCR